MTESALELDHVFSFVRAEGDSGAGPPRADEISWRARLAASGLVLDGGIRHEGQGTQNQRLAFAGQFLELLWLFSHDQAAENALRLDRRADWRTTGASPFGIGLRGRVPAALAHEFWLYRPAYAPEARIWIHESNESAPERPFVFVMEADPSAFAAFKARIAGSAPDHTRPPLDLVSVAIAGPGAPPPWLASLSPPVLRAEGDGFHMALEIEGAGAPFDVQVTPQLRLVVRSGSASLDQGQQ
jgi:hypothetical protein